MFGLGTIINTAAIVVAGILGHFIGGLLKERFQKILTLVMGLSVSAMSVSGVVSKMLVYKDGSFSTQGTYMIIFSLVLGCLLGEILNIDKRLEDFGRYLRNKTGNAKDAAFVDAFVTTSLIVCIGAMAVIGSIMDALYGDISILLTKAILDFVIVMVMSSSHGKGSAFSAVPVFLFQGSITLLAFLLEPILSSAALDNLSLVGSILILCVGINLICDGRFRIKVANLLPSIVFAVAAAYIPFLME